MHKYLTSFFSLIIFLFCTFVVYAQENILVYAGPGAGPKSVANTVGMLKSLVSDQYLVKTVDAEELIQVDWLHNTALLVMPGGADLPYVEKLTGPGNANIKRFVANGGKFIGICAGAYYSADRIEFAKGDAILEVTGDRELKFFPGLVVGPTYVKFDQRVATIYWQAEQPFMVNQEFAIYHFGGGHFVAAENYPSVKILARYARELPAQPQQPAAIVECAVGKGTAILSGLHFEWDPMSIETNDQLPNNKILVAMRMRLTANEVARLALARHLLTRLAIDLR